MKTPKQMNTVLFASVVAITAFGASAVPALSQAKIYQVADCAVPHSTSERQECAIERSRQQLYTGQDIDTGQPAVLPDRRPVMTPDNGGGGTQSPVVPNTTGAPITTGFPIFD